MTKKKIFTGLVPFDAEGNQLTYALPPSPYNSKYYQADKWEPNFVFEDTLVYDGYFRGRSAAHFHFRRKSTGTRVTFFISDFDDAMLHTAGGSLTGKFTFKKGGQNYGCRMIIDVQP